MRVAVNACGLWTRSWCDGLVGIHYDKAYCSTLIVERVHLFLLLALPTCTSVRCTCTDRRRSVTSDIGRLRKAFTYLLTYLAISDQQCPSWHVSILLSGTRGMQQWSVDNADQTRRSTVTEKACHIFVCGRLVWSGLKAKTWPGSAHPSVKWASLQFCF